MLSCGGSPRSGTILGGAQPYGVPPKSRVRSGSRIGKARPSIERTGSAGVAGGMRRNGSVRRRLGSVSQEEHSENCHEGHMPMSTSPSLRSPASVGQRSPLFTVSPGSGRANEPPPSLALDSAPLDQSKLVMIVTPPPVKESWVSIPFQVDMHIMNQLKQDSRNRGSAYHTVVFSLFLLALRQELGDSFAAAFRIMRNGARKRSVSILAKLGSAIDLSALVATTSRQLLGLLEPGSILGPSDEGQDILFALLPASKAPGQCRNDDTQLVGYAEDWSRYTKASLILAVEDVPEDEALHGCLRYRPKKEAMAKKIVDKLVSLHQASVSDGSWECSLADFGQRRPTPTVTAACVTATTKIGMPLARQGHVSGQTKVCAACRCSVSPHQPVFFAYDRMFCNEDCRRRYIVLAHEQATK
eukprot:COSAG05_NODE_1243_length_5412_cov_2.064510_3_plen_414_part_00